MINIFWESHVKKDIWSRSPRNVVKPPWFGDDWAGVAGRSGRCLRPFPEFWLLTRKNAILQTSIASFTFLKPQNQKISSHSWTAPTSLWTSYNLLSTKVRLWFLCSFIFVHISARNILYNWKEAQRWFFYCQLIDSEFSLLPKVYINKSPRLVECIGGCAIEQFYVTLL